MILIKFRASMFDYSLCAVLEVSKGNQISSQKHMLHNTKSISFGLYSNLYIYGLLHLGQPIFLDLHIQIFNASLFFTGKYKHEFRDIDRASEDIYLWMASSKTVDIFGFTRLKQYTKTYQWSIDKTLFVIVPKLYWKPR